MFHKNAIRSRIEKIKYVLYLCRLHHRQGHLSVIRQLMEILWLQTTRGIGYSKYHYAQMWHRDASWDYKTSFLSQRDFVKKIHEINKRKYHGVTQFKPLEKSFFQIFNIPSAEYVGTFNKQWGITSNGKPLQTEANMKDVLRQYIGEKICFKLIEGDGGKGFKAYLILKKEGDTHLRHLSSGDEFSISELFNLLEEESPAGWLLEKYIDQHPTLKALNPSSTNTIRLYVFQDKNNILHVLNSYFRVGREHSLIDNNSAGGLVCRIDHDTGRLQRACQWSPELHSMCNHPDHGIQIEGTIIPFWTDAMELGKKTLSVLPETRFIGLDIAITENGPIIVEVNVQPASDGLSFTQIQTARVFNS